MDIKTYCKEVVSAILSETTLENRDYTAEIIMLSIFMISTALHKASFPSNEANSQYLKSFFDFEHNDQITKRTKSIYNLSVKLFENPNGGTFSLGEILEITNYEIVKHYNELMDKKNSEIGLD